MDDPFPYVHVPVELRKVLGEPLPGTRLYRKEGPEDESLYWDDAVFKVFGHCVSPGGAAVRAGVSRAAVHQRLKDGKLTGFFYYSTKPRRFLFGTPKSKRELSFGYIPVSECLAWRKELEKRAVERGMVTAEELEGEVPDWQGWFLEWNSKFAKQRTKGRTEG